MRRSTKAVLLSALIFPGAGHFFLKYYFRGAALIGLSMSGVTFILVDTVEKSFGIIDKLQSGQAQLAPEAVAKMLEQQATGSGSLAVNLATYGVLLCWVIGIVDSYRIGKNQDA